jgi:hypothetical protein
MVTAEQIAFEAQARARRCGRTILLKEDCQQAGMTVLLRMHYEKIVDIELSGNPKVKLGVEAKTCRYCQRPKSAGGFRDEAHAIPECLGNKRLISFDECDACNNAFSKTFEGQFGRFTLPLRALLGMGGKRKRVTKYEMNGSMAWLDRARQCFVVFEKEGFPPILEYDEARNRHIFRLPCPEFCPLDVYRSLVKIGLSLLDPPELRRYGYLREWLLAGEAVPDQLCGIYGVAYFSYSFVAAKSPRVCVWERKALGLPFPSLLVGITLPHLAFAFAMPPAPLDPVDPGVEMFLPRFDLSHQPGWTNTVWDEMDMREATPMKNGILTLVLHGGEPCTPPTDDDWFAGTGYALQRYRDKH